MITKKSRRTLVEFGAEPTNAEAVVHVLMSANAKLSACRRNAAQ